MKVIIIGAGAAGLMAACSAGECGHEVLLLEKNDRFGKKLAITGKGRCNVTNNCTKDELIKNTPRNGKFLYSAFRAFDAEDTMRFFADAGVELKTERGNRVFPASDRAGDIVDALVNTMKRYKVTFVFGEAKELVITGGAFQAVNLSDGRCLTGDRVILATGGLSYPKTGSTGDGYAMAGAVGHSIAPLRPALVPLVIRQSCCRDMMGLSLKNVSLTLFEDGVKRESDFGEMLFTHFGVSGPMVLSLSAHMRYAPNRYALEIDLKPALDEAQLDKRLLRDFEKYAKRSYSNALVDLLPQKMIPVVVRLSDIDPLKPAGSIQKEERKRLLHLLKHFRLEVVDFRPISEAIITSGGIDVSEVNPSTMESKLVHGLFFAGELLDVNAYTGGFNLQIAFATGYLAGKNV